MCLYPIHSDDRHSMVYFLKISENYKYFQKHSFNISFHILFFLWELKFICQFWIFLFWILPFMTRKAVMSKSFFTENLRHILQLDWLYLWCYSAFLNIWLIKQNMAVDYTNQSHVGFLFLISIYLYKMCYYLLIRVLEIKG